VTGTSTALATVRFRAGIGGEPIVADMSASAAHSFQPARWGATIVNSTAHPVAGDHLGLNVTVGVGCCAEIRSAAPTLARRGSRRPPWSGPSSSTFEVTATVASDAMLTWHPEPGVAADACQHRSDANVELASSARLLWQDEFLLERRNESAPGTWSSRLRVVRDGWPVVCTELAVGPGSPLWESPAVLEGARVVTLVVVVDPGQVPDQWCSARANEGSATGVALPLAGPGVQIVAWGDELSGCRATVDTMIEACGVPEWAAGRWRAARDVGAVV